MNNDTIKAAEEYSNNLSVQFGFVAGSNFMQAQKDKQIKELVEALEQAVSIIDNRFISTKVMQECKELIQKHKQAQ